MASFVAEAAALVTQILYSTAISLSRPSCKKTTPAQ